MAIRRITCKGGPLHGKRYDVPVGLSKFDATGGTYRVSEKQATWEPEKPAPTKAADEPKAKS